MLTKNLPCPNCGKKAERHYISSSNLTKTQCPSCDYLMLMCSQSGKVIEAYAPGINPDCLKLTCPKKVIYKPQN